MTTKAFVIGEIQKALMRLRATVLFIAKVLCIALINLFFWFLPLILTGYLLGRPFFLRYDPAPEGQPVTISAEHHYTSVAGGSTDETTHTFGGLLPAGRDLLREIRFWRRR